MTKSALLITTPALFAALPAELQQWRRDRVNEGWNCPAPYPVPAGMTGRGLREVIRAKRPDAVLLLGSVPAIASYGNPDYHYSRRLLTDYWLVTDEEPVWSGTEPDTALTSLMFGTPFSTVGRVWFEGLDSVSDPVEATRRWLNRRHDYAVNGSTLPLRIDWENHLASHNITDDAIRDNFGTLSPLLRQVGLNIINDGAFGDDGAMRLEATDGAQLGVIFTGGSEFPGTPGLYAYGLTSRLLTVKPRLHHLFAFGSFAEEYYNPNDLLRTFLSMEGAVTAGYDEWNGIDFAPMASGMSFGEVCRAGAVRQRSAITNLLGCPT